MKTGVYAEPPLSTYKQILSVLCIMWSQVSCLYGLPSGLRLEPREFALAIRPLVGKLSGDAGRIMLRLLTSEFHIEGAVEVCVCLRACLCLSLRVSSLGLACGCAHWFALVCACSLCSFSVC